MADRHMRTLVASLPDGEYHGEAVLEDSGHGYGELKITADVTVSGDELDIKISSPPQIPYFINSYSGNSLSGIYLGLMMFAEVTPPYNEGLYRCVKVDLGPKGTLCNAIEPAPHVNCTTTPMETLTDAVRCALEKAAPDKVSASWGHTSGINIAGQDPRTADNDEYVTMVLASVISGAGATQHMDGWHACGPLCCFGALSSGDVELLEHSYPIIIHRYGLSKDSGGAGRFRGGCGAVWEVEPIDHEMTIIGFGEGRQRPTLSVAGAENKLVDEKLGRLEIIDQDGETEKHIVNVLTTIKPGQRVRNVNPGGGGFGAPFEREIKAVQEDVVNGLVSIEAAKLEYGVCIDPETLQADERASMRFRQTQA